MESFGWYFNIGSIKPMRCLYGGISIYVLLQLFGSMIGELNFLDFLIS
jgi:hypothetical protein